MRPSAPLRRIATLALIAAASPALSQTVGSPGSFPLHEEHGGATLIERTGLGSPSARMVGEFTRADIKEMCERIGWKFYSPSFPFHGTLQDRQTIGICRTKEEARPLEDRRYEVRANCPDGLLWNDMGYTFRRVGTEWQTQSGRPVVTEFSAGYARVVARQFDMLCSGNQFVADARDSVTGSVQSAPNPRGSVTGGTRAQAAPAARGYAADRPQRFAEAQPRAW